MKEKEKEKVVIEREIKRGKEILDERKRERKNSE